jgi:hypothetical protein
MAVSLTVKIEDPLVATLNQGSRDLDAVLIVHPEHGADIFIVVSGHFRKLGSPRILSIDVLSAHLFCSQSQLTRPSPFTGSVER